MIQYTSHITITIKNYEKKTAILESLKSFCERLVEHSDFMVSMVIVSTGSPDLSNIATIIWWANQKYCDVEILVTESVLKYASPKTYDQLDYEIITKDADAFAYANDQALRKS